MKNAIVVLGSLSILGILSAGSTRADWSNSDYQTLLHNAEKYVEKQKAKPLPAALSAHMTNLSFHSSPTYAVGQNWNTVSFQELPLNSSTGQSRGRSAAFHFEVMANQADLRIRVKPIAAYGLANIDPNVQYADFVYSNNLQLVAKYYKLRNYPDLIPLSPDNFKVGVSVMEGYPLELPQLSAAEADPDCNLAALALPETFKAAAEQAGYRGFALVETCLMNSDFFGRTIQSIWPAEQPFPSFMKTTQGLSVLAHQEVR